MIETEGIKNLIRIDDQKKAEEVLNQIAIGEKVVVSIQSQNGQHLIHEQKCVLVFDVCLRGESRYNAVSILRDLLKANHSSGQWTRKKVEALVDFMA